MLDIIIPVYNEAEYIKATLDEIKRCVHVDMTVHIVYDKDEDNTLPVVRDCIASGEYPYAIELMKNKYGRGALNAILTGLQDTNAEYKLIMMADLSDNLEVVDTMYAKAKEGYDVVCGSRYVKGGSQVGAPKFKSFLSRMAGLSLNLLTRIPTHDCTNSFKMYSDKLIKNIKIESNGGFEIGLEILTKAWVNGYKITEVPSQWQEDEGRVSNFHLFKWLRHYLKWYFYCVYGTYFVKNKKK